MFFHVNNLFYLFINLFYFIAVNCTLMSRTKRETSVGVNVVLMMNKSCFLYLGFSSSPDDFGVFFSVLFVSVVCCQKLSIHPGGAQPSD